ASGADFFREPAFVALWVGAIAFLMISNIATLSWTSLRPRRSMRLPVIALVGIAFAALLTEPWWTLAAINLSYLALMPWGILSYARIMRQRAARLSAAPAGGQTG